MISTITISEMENNIPGFDSIFIIERFGSYSDENFIVWIKNNLTSSLLMKVDRYIVIDTDIDDITGETELIRYEKPIYNSYFYQLFCQNKSDSTLVRLKWIDEKSMNLVKIKNNGKYNAE